MGLIERSYTATELHRLNIEFAEKPCFARVMLQFGPRNETAVGHEEGPSTPRQPLAAFVTQPMSNDSLFSFRFCFRGTYFLKSIKYIHYFFFCFVFFCFLFSVFIYTFFVLFFSNSTSRVTCFVVPGPGSNSIERSMDSMAPTRWLLCDLFQTMSLISPNYAAISPYDSAGASALSPPPLSSSFLRTQVLDAIILTTSDRPGNERPPPL